MRRIQKHAKLTAAFGPRVTTVVGETGAGKSAFLRSLKFLLFNHWRKQFLRHGAKTAAVELFIDGRRVKRVKGKGVNCYHLDGKKLSAVGKTGVPEEIARLLNVTPANFQNQHDALFWFSETPGAISKKLNKIVNLELIDSSLAAAGAGVRDAGRRLADAKEELKAAKEAEETTRWMDDFVAKGRRLAKAKKELDKTDEELQELKSLVTQARNARGLVKAQEQAVNVGRKVVSAGRELVKVDGQVSDLGGLITQARRYKAAAGVTMPEFDGLKAVRKEADETADDCAQLEGLVADAKAARRSALLAKMELVAKAVMLNHLKKHRKKEDKKCRLCGSPLPPSGTSTPASSGRGAGRRRTGLKSNAGTSSS